MVASPTQRRSGAQEQSDCGHRFRRRHGRISPPAEGAGSPSVSLLPAGVPLPAFDEYVIGYKNWEGIIHQAHADKVVPDNNGMFLSTIVVDGQVVGLWSRANRKGGVTLTMKPFGKLAPGTARSDRRSRRDVHPVPRPAAARAVNLPHLF